MSNSLISNDQKSPTCINGHNVQDAWYRRGEVFAATGVVDRQDIYLNARPGDVAAFALGVQNVVGTKLALDLMKHSGILTVVLADLSNLISSPAKLDGKLQEVLDFVRGVLKEISIPFQWETPEQAELFAYALIELISAAPLASKELKYALMTLEMDLYCLDTDRAAKLSRKMDDAAIFPELITGFPDFCGGQPLGTESNRAG